MPRWICYYHLVWSTRNREPLLIPPIELVVYAVIERESAKMDSPVLAIGGIEDHVHVAVMIRPRIAVATWVRQIKGVSAHEVNRQFPHQETHFRWQGSYSVQTFGKKTLPFVLNYIQHQKQHHASRTSILYLEETGDADDPDEQ